MNKQTATENSRDDGCQTLSNKQSPPALPNRIHFRHVELENSVAFCRRYHEIATFRDAEIVIYGGVSSTTEPLGSFILMNPRSGAVKQYSCKLGPLPPARTGHCGAVCTIKNSVLQLQPENDHTTGLLVVGGWRGSKLKTAPNDVWFLDILGLRWIQPLSEGDVPGHANLGTLSTLSDKEAVLFLGGDGTNFLNELYVFNLKSGVWWRPQRQGKIPDKRAGHSSAVIDQSKLIIFGGWNGVDTLSDCWLWNRETEAWLEVDMAGSALHPGPRTDASLSKVGEYVLLLGGRGMSKEAELLPFMGSSISGLQDSDRPSLAWDSLEWQGKNRVGHKTAVCGSMMVVVGGLHQKDPLDAEPSPCASAQFILLDSQEGFILDRACISGRERIPELSLFCTSECLSDVRFDIQGFVFPAHRLVLCLKSVVFRRMFTRGLTESKAVSTYPLRGPPDASPCVFEVFLLYLYSFDLAAAFLKQQKAPWSKTTDRDVFSRMVTHILGAVTVDESLRHASDLPEHVRVVMDAKLFTSTWPSETLPFSKGAREELLQLMLCLLQLADEYMITSLFHLCEIVIAHLVDEVTSGEAVQWAVALKAPSLLSYLEWIQRYLKSNRRPISLDMTPTTATSTEGGKVLKPPVVADHTSIVSAARPLPSDSEDYTIGFPTLAELPNAQSSWAGPPTQSVSHNPSTPALEPVAGDSLIIQRVEIEALTDRAATPTCEMAVHFPLTRTDAVVLGSAAPEDLTPKEAVDLAGKEGEGQEAAAMNAGTPPQESVVTDDYLGSSERSAATEPITTESDKDPAFPGLVLSQDNLERKDSADHSVRSSPVRTPTFDPTFVAEPDEFAPLPPASPTRKLSQRLVGKFRRTSAQPTTTNNEQVLKSDKSFTQRFRNRFSRRIGHLPAGSAPPINTPATDVGSVI